MPTTLKKKIFGEKPAADFLPLGESRLTRPPTGLPASFRVLVKELQSLGLAVTAVFDNGEVNTFGKEEDHQKKAPIRTSLTDNIRTDTTKISLEDLLN